VIFNVASTLSAIASSQNRAEADGRKRAFHYFQASAGMFQYINDNFLHAPSEDLSRETVNMLSELMLAQAHECFLESSIREKKKDGLIAKLASHAAWVYGNLVDSIGDANHRGVGIDKSWLTICQVKQKYYAALAQEHKASACAADQQYGECTSRYAAAESAAKEASKLAGSISNTNLANGSVPPDTSASLQELSKSLTAACTEKLNTATRDNDMIYHETVPQESVLTPIDRLKAVKVIPITELYGPDELKKVIGADLFSRLIPISVHESASLYSEEKAKLLRLENERCDIAKAELNASLDYMKLPGSLSKFKQQQQQQQQQKNSANSLDEYASPPSEVRQWSSQILEEEQRTPLGDLLNSLTALRSRARQTLEEAGLCLDQEMRECENNRVKYGDQWTQTPSGSSTSEFRHDIQNHRQTLDGAVQSDNQLLARYEAARRNIDILKQGNSHGLEAAYSEALSSLFGDSKPTQDPKTSLLDLDISTEEDNTSDDLDKKVQKIESIIEKLKRIESDRDETFRDLKDKTMQDDISQLLILNKKANVEQQIFASELEKFRPHQQRITATIQHQQQAIQDLTIAFKSLMEGKEAQTLQTRYDKADRLSRSLTEDLREGKTAYFDVKDGASRGVQFYSGLQETIESLMRHIQRFVADRAQERSRLLESIESNKSSREQELLFESLNKYSSSAAATAPPPLSTPSAPSAPSAPPPAPLSASSSTISQLSNQTRQMSIGDLPPPSSNPSHGYTPTPPPKPQAFMPQQQQQQPPQQSQGMFNQPSYQPMMNQAQPPAQYSPSNMYTQQQRSPAVSSPSHSIGNQPNMNLYQQQPMQMNYPQQQQQQQFNNGNQGGYNPQQGFPPQSPHGYRPPPPLPPQPHQQQPSPQQHQQGFGQQQFPPQQFPPQQQQQQFPPQQGFGQQGFNQQGFPPQQQQQNYGQQPQGMPPQQQQNFYQQQPQGGMRPPQMMQGYNGNQPWQQQQQQPLQPQQAPRPPTESLL
jgi:hypothetical protein